MFQMSYHTRSLRKTDAFCVCWQLFRGLQVKILNLSNPFFFNYGDPSWVQSKTRIQPKRVSFDSHFFGLSFSKKRCAEGTPCPPQVITVPSPEDRGPKNAIFEYLTEKNA